MDVHSRCCDDCGRSSIDAHGERRWGFGSVITHTGESRLYCSDCKVRRGLAYLFDARSWAQIERATKGSAA